VLTRLAGGRIFDPAQGLNGTVQDLWFSDGLMVSPPEAGVVPGVEDVVRGVPSIFTVISPAATSIQRVCYCRNNTATSWRES